MKARIMEKPVRVYSDAGLNSISIAELPVGTEVELGSVKKVDGKSWISVELSPGQRGYIPGETRIYHIKQVMLNQRNVNVYTGPSLQSVVKTQFTKNTKFYLLEVFKQNDMEWVKIRDMSGNEGFIDGKTKTRVVPEKVIPTKAIGKKNMLVGALWFFGGIVVTVVTYSAASSGGGTYFITWGAILFGGIQLIQGLIQFLNAAD
jgi:hypothetical protein